MFIAASTTPPLSPVGTICPSPVLSAISGAIKFKKGPPCFYEHIVPVKLKRRRTTIFYEHIVPTELIMKKPLYIPKACLNLVIHFICESTFAELSQIHRLSVYKNRDHSPQVHRVRFYHPSTRHDYGSHNSPHSGVPNLIF